jgi:hypothetical protein
VPKYRGLAFSERTISHQIIPFAVDHHVRIGIFVSHIMRAFWITLLLLLALVPLLLPFRRGDSWRQAFRKSALQVIAEVFPRKYRVLVGLLYLALVLFALGKVKGLF